MSPHPPNQQHLNQSHLLVRDLGHSLCSHFRHPPWLCGTSCHVHFWGCHLYCRSCSSPLLPNCLPRSPHRPYSSGTRHRSIADQPSGCRLCHQLKEGSCFCLCWYCFRSWSCYSCPWLARSRKEGRMALSLLDFSRYFTCVLFVHGIHSARPAEARIWRKRTSYDWGRRNWANLTPLAIWFSFNPSSNLHSGIHFS